jgi:hypothetical protein
MRTVLDQELDRGTVGHLRDPTEVLSERCGVWLACGTCVEYSHWQKKIAISPHRYWRAPHVEILLLAHLKVDAVVAVAQLANLNSHSVRKAACVDQA